MSDAIAKIFGESKSTHSLDICRQRVAMAAVAISILFLAALVVTL
ncbi:MULTISPECIES: hypothetical protein [Rhizobiaceae]|nr:MULTISPECIES: hypothetical protein [unclassified Rhizobium]